jgi:hydrogenase nickel incorporation protein HypB
MKINVIKSVLHANDAVAAANQARLDGRNVLGINLLSAPGSGKTSLLEKTLPALGDAHPSSVLVGDLQTTRDAERIQPYALETVQINTGTGCHLSAVQVSEGLNQLDLDRISFLFIENVGNMVCPAAFDLGEHLKAVLLSVPEGDDKVAKYPTLFQRADVILLNKIDLLGVLEFSTDRVREDLAQINTRAPLIEISCSTGQGLDEWLTWLHSQRRARIEEQEAPQALR